MADNLSNVIVGADVKFPTHDVSLTDVDGKQAGLILCNRNGIKDPTQLRMAAMPSRPGTMTRFREFRIWSDKWPLMGLPMIMPMPMSRIILPVATPDSPATLIR